MTGVLCFLYLDFIGNNDGAVIKFESAETLIRIASKHDFQLICCADIKIAHKGRRVC